MPVIFLYFFKVMICSAALYGYYRLALFNRPFHQWNRVYLLFAALISPVIPLMKWSVLPTLSAPVEQFMPVENMRAKMNGVFEGSAPGVHHQLSMTGIVEMLYAIIGLLVFLRMIIALVRIYGLIKRSVVLKRHDHFLVMTAEKNAPFSFFSYVFWNISIGLNTVAGRKMLEHELAHVYGKHSVDKLLINMLTAAFWYNPFYWLIRRELGVVHEFIADSKTLGPGEQAELSGMILLAAYPSRNFSVTSNFYSSSIKRRLHMLNKSFHQKKNYLRFLLAVPVLFTLLAAFTFTHKRNIALPSSAKAITVVIDAGHGGRDNGAMAGDGTKEKNLALALAKKIQQVNTDPNIRILLTRTGDVYQELNDKVDFALKAKPDVFISMHVNADTSGARGIEFYISRDKPQYSQQVNALESLISQQVRSVYPSGIVTKQAVNHVWVLDAPKVNYPAILIECGNILNAEDLAFINDPKHQEEIAMQIVKALGSFAASR